jgi:hypothetical protein
VKNDLSKGESDHEKNTTRQAQPLQLRQINVLPRGLKVQTLALDN